MTTKTSERKYLTIGAGMIKYLDDLLEYVQPQPYIVSSTDYNGGDIPVLTANQSFILGYTDEKNGIFYASEKCPVIIFDDFTCDIKFVDFPFKVKSSALKILRSRTDPSTLKFVYEMMKLTIPLSNNHKRHWISETSHLAYAMPSTNDQVSISKLSTLIDKIMQSQRQEICLLRQILSTIYNYWFVQFDFPDENGRPYKSSGGKMVYNEQLKQEIPEGWKCKKLIDLFDFMRGTEVGSDAYADKKISDDYIRFWRVRDVGNDCKTWIDGNARNLTTVKPGDVVITLDGTVGKIGIDLDGAISGGLRHVVDHTNTISNATICAILQSDYVQESLRQYVSGRGSILAHASGALQHLAIPYDKNIFNKFQNIIQPMFDLMINSKEQSKQLASLRDWLLPMLMNGQVEIRERKEASNDQV